MKSSQLCRTTLIRILIAVALISSLLILPAFSQDTQDSQIFISGFNAYQQQNYSTAIDRMNEVLKKYPDTPLRDMALFWLARAHFKSGHRQDAARTMSQFSREFPDNPLKGTVEEELLTLAAAYDKGEKIPAALDAKPTGPERQVARKAGQEQVTSAAAEEARLAAARMEQERVAAEKAKQQQATREAAETARQAKLKAEQEHQASEQARLASLKAEQERAAAAEESRLAAARKEQERIATEKAEQLRAAAEAAEAERLASLKAGQERQAAEHKRLAAQKTEQERAAAAAEEARLATTRKEQERIAAENAEQVRAAAEAAETARVATLKAEQERRAAEQSRLAAVKAEQERAAAAVAKEARLEAARKEQVRVAAEKAAAEAESARLAAAQAEKDRNAAAKAEEQRLKKQHEAAEKSRTAKALLREKAISQYKSVIQTYPNTKSAAVAAARLKELGISVAQPPQAVAAGRPQAETSDNAQVLQLEVVQFAGFEFRIMAAPRAYDVGRRISLAFEVTNQGNGNDSFQFESGFPAEFQASFSSSQAPDLAINKTPPLAPNETFKGFVTLTIPSTSIDGLRIAHPIKASSSFMAEATQSREIQISASAPLLRAVLKTDQIRPLPGEKLVYRLVILNVGSTAASDVSVRLNFPPQLESLDHAQSGFKPDGKSALILEGLHLKSGERKEFTVAFQLKDDSLAGQDLVTRAELIDVPLKTRSTFVSNLANVNAQHGIKVRSGSERLVIIPGETVNVPFIVTNTGNTRDTFKIAATVTGARTSTIFHDLNRDGIRQANEPAISEIGPLEPKEEARVVMEINTSRDSADGSEGSVRLAFSPEGTTAAAGSGSARLIYSRPVLQLAMSRPDGRLKPGEITSYDLTVTNRGSNLARVVELQSAWPEQLELVAAEPANSSAATGTIHWKFKELGAGEKLTIKVSFRVKPGIGVGTSIRVKNSLNYEDQLGNRY